MRSVTTIITYLCMLTGIIVFAAACSSTADIGEPPSDAVCSEIVDAKCVRCHYKTRICEALGTKSVGNWKRTVKFMVKQGAELTDDEQNKVIACLSALPKGSEIVCE